MKLETFDNYVTEATSEAGLVVKPPVLSLFPYYDIMGRSASLAAAYVTSIGSGTSQHTVCVSYQMKDGEADFAIWCGDKFLEGRGMSQDEAKSRCDEALGTLPNKTNLRAEMMKQFKSQAESGRCSFWSDWRSSKKLCSHTTTALAFLRDNVPDFKAQMQAVYDNASSGSTPTVAGKETMELAELAFRVPVLFEGERGAGKTVTARLFARTNGFKRVEFGGHEGLESPDLLGYLVPTEQSSMVWKDGPLAEAFRSAQKQKTVLIIDELLRIRQRELSILLTALSPDEGVYRLRTGRILRIEDGIATEEELECPVENLCIVATTNVGAEYAVDDIDPALAERFVIIRKDTTVAELKRILTEEARKKGFSTGIVTKCITFFTKMTEARSRGLVKHAPTTRTLVRAITLAGSADEVKRCVKTHVLLWVARNSEGHPVPEQLSDVDKLIERCFS